MLTGSRLLQELAVNNEIPQKEYVQNVVHCGQGSALDNGNGED